MADIFNPGQESVQVTASPNLQSEKARFDPNGSVNALLASLGSESTRRTMEDFNAANERKKLEEQNGKFDWYVEQFQKDHTGGAVSQAQIKGRFPETVPVIASRIAEAVGEKEGHKQFAAVVEEINGNDALRLDSTARAAFLAQKRKEMTDALKPGNDFYGAGVVGSVNKLTRQYEMTWANETAAYHQKVQADQFSKETVEAINSGDSQALLNLDVKWGKSSSLNNVERNKIVVDSAIDLAFVNDDPKVLGAIPDRFLSVDAKSHLQKAGVQLTERRMTEFRNAQYLKTVQREEALRSTKTEIVKDVAAGKTIDPGKYRGDSEGFQFALTMREAPRLDESTSQASAQSIRNLILTSTTVGEMGTVQSLTDKIVGNPNLNPKERQKLIEELPKLIEGRNLMSDDMVRQPITDRLNPALNALEQSKSSTIQSLLTGRNLRSEVMKGYDSDIRRSFQAELEETGKWPTGHRKLDLIDKATDRAETRLRDLTKISALGKPDGATSAPAAAPKPAAPAAPKATPSAVKANPIDAAIAAELAKRK